MLRRLGFLIALALFVPAAADAQVFKPKSSSSKKAEPKAKSSGTKKAAAKKSKKKTSSKKKKAAAKADSDEAESAPKEADKDYVMITDDEDVE